MDQKNIIIELGPMGPIGEQDALILRVNRNCPWNRCLFCSVYKDKKFSIRNKDDVKKDIDAVAYIQSELEKISWEMGTNGRINGETIRETLRRYPAVFGRFPHEMSPEQAHAVNSLGAVASWLLHGAKRVFLQDADALITKTDELAEIILYLKEAFPSIDIVSSYARSKTCRNKSSGELAVLKAAGLNWCYVGIESGSDDVLTYMKKGVTRKEHIEGGKRFMESGISMAAFIMPGLGGGEALFAKRHIEDTISVLNEIRPSEVRIRSLAVHEASPLYDSWLSGDFHVPTDDLMIEELCLLIHGLDFDCIFETLQMTNPLFAVRGRFSELKEDMCQSIEEYRVLNADERARFIFKRYVDEGYLSFVRRWGKCDEELQRIIETARI
ncbi:MAG: hypothetical protein RBS82_11945, partial [Syntrophales bacterium]|nr:hypothetical protein [Syntrophales bacterium]